LKPQTCGVKAGNDRQPEKKEEPKRGGERWGKRKSRNSLRKENESEVGQEKDRGVFFGKRKIGDRKEFI